MPALKPAPKPGPAANAFAHKAAKKLRAKQVEGGNPYAREYAGAKQRRKK
jgi:hypothetical protein